jgi:hypothetical protein
MAESFRLEEYKMLRAKSQHTIGRIEDLERNVILFCGAILSVSMSPTFKPEYKYQSLIVYVLPLCVSIVGFLRYRGLYLYVKELSDYTIKIEKELGGDSGGWLHYYYSPERDRSDADYRFYRITIWWAIIAFNAVAAMGLIAPIVVRLGRASCP